MLASFRIIAFVASATVLASAAHARPLIRVDDNVRDFDISSELVGEEYAAAVLDHFMGEVLTDEVTETSFTLSSSPSAYDFCEYWRIEGERIASMELEWVTKMVDLLEEFQLSGLGADQFFDLHASGSDPIPVGSRDVWLMLTQTPAALAEYRRWQSYGTLDCQSARTHLLESHGSWRSGYLQVLIGRYVVEENAPALEGI